MDDRRSEDAAEEPLSDRALDRELAAAFDVDPSPEFLARVRLHIANEPADTGWLATQRWNWSGWGFAAAIAAMLAVVAVYSMWPRSNVVQPREAAAPAPGIDLGPVPQIVREEPALDRPVVDPGSTRVERGSSRRATRPSADGPRAIASAESKPGVQPDRGAGLASPPADAPKLSEVLISLDEVRAFERVLAAAQGRRVVPDSEPAREASVTEPVKLPDIEIGPVIIEPLPQLARLEGVRQ